MSFRYVFGGDGRVELETFPDKLNVAGMLKLREGLFVVALANKAERTHDVTPNFDYHFRHCG